MDDPDQQPRSQKELDSLDSVSYSTYRASLVALGLLIALLLFGCLTLLNQQDLANTIPQIHRQGISGFNNVTSRMLLLKIILVPIISACLSVLIAAQAITFLRFVLYVRGLNLWLRQQLLVMVGSHSALLPLTGVRFDSEGHPHATEEPLPVLVLSARQVVILGDPGAGKTVALFAIAEALSGRRALLRLWTGRSPLPICVSLIDVAASVPHVDANISAYLHRQVSRIGSPGLSARLSLIAQRQGIIVLCDNLDVLHDADRSRMCSALAALTADEKNGIRIVLTCQHTTYTDRPRLFSALPDIHRIAINGLRQGVVVQALRQIPVPRGLKRPARGEIATELHKLRLDHALSLPAGIAALRRVWRNDSSPLPVGRAHLYVAAVKNVCNQSENPAMSEQALRVLSSIASALRNSDQHTIDLDQEEDIGTAIDRWLAHHPPLAATEHVYMTPQTPEPTPAEMTHICEEAVRLGILRQTTDGRTLYFTDMVEEATCAAHWLLVTDDGFGRLPAELLRPQWILPTLLWAGLQESPVDLAPRLLRLAQTPDTTAARAGFASRIDAGAAALALALASTVEGLTVSLAQLTSDSPTAPATIDRAEQHLRDLLDQAQLYLSHPDQLFALSHALTAIERLSGPELISNMDLLVTDTRFSRLVRAEIIIIFGVLASPTSLKELVELLVESDPILRQALAQAFMIAGAAALAPLKQALSHPNERICARASEVLDLLSDEAATAALEALRSSDNSTGDRQQRVTATKALGAIRFEQATQTLIMQLDDADSNVQVASALALGQIATREAFSALDKAAQSPNAELRRTVAQALGESRDPAVTPTLLNLLNDADGQVRAMAANMLGALGDERAISSLQEHQTDSDVWTQNAAIGALHRLEG